MARPDHHGGTLTLEHRLEELRSSLPPGEQEIIGLLLQQVADVRGAEVKGGEPETRASEMPESNIPGGAGDMPTTMATQLTSRAGDMPIDDQASAPEATATGMPQASEMPASTELSGESNVSPSGPNEMPEARAEAVTPVPAPASMQLASEDGAVVLEDSAGNEMPSVMPDFGAGNQMPVATGAPY